MFNISDDTFASLLSLAAFLFSFVLLSTGIIPARAIETMEHGLRSLARRQALLLVLIPAISLTLNVSIALKNGFPHPHIQDEFSYLLAGDTFAHGRVTNPTPAFWEHFETPHELMRPTYMSKYPPGQAISLAIGQILTAAPIIGVWLTTAAGCAMVYWMLLAFVQPTWAMLGGFVAVFHPLLLHWSQIYWGGSVAFLGGAIVLGAWGRLMARPAVGSAIMLGLGLIILANSRPFEGLVLVVPLMLRLAWKSIRDNQFKSYAARVGIPALAILLPAAAAMGYYNFRVTGDLLRMPFMEYARQYDVYPKFWFLPKRPEPVYLNDSMRAIHTVYERGDYDTLRTLKGFIQICLQRSWKLISMHADPWLLLIPLLAAIPVALQKTVRWVWLSVLTLLIGLWAENFFLDHYAAPVTAAMLLLILIGWQRLSQWTFRGRMIGRLLARSIGCGFFVAALFTFIAPIPPGTKRIEQSGLVDQAKSLQAGKHLIFVRYTPGHLIHDEWVYNQPDLENARIIWARYIGSAADAPVATHYSGREVWLLTVGKDDLVLNAYAPR